MVIYFPSKFALQKRLENVQIGALRAALGYRISSPKNIILAESSLTTIKERAKPLGRCFICKTIINSNCPANDVIKKFTRSGIRAKAFERDNNVLKECISFSSTHAAVLHLERL